MFKRWKSRSNLNLEVLVFVESRERTNNKLNLHETASGGIEPGSQSWDWGERLSTAPPVLPVFYHAYVIPLFSFQTFRLVQ